MSSSLDLEFINTNLKKKIPQSKVFVKDVSFSIIGITDLAHMIINYPHLGYITVLLIITHGNHAIIITVDFHL